MKQNSSKLIKKLIFGNISLRWGNTKVDKKVDIVQNRVDKKMRWGSFKVDKKVDIFKYQPEVGRKSSTPAGAR